MRRKAVIRFDPRLVADKLGLPEGTRIEHIQHSFERVDSIEMVVSHPSLPEVDPGSMLPAVSVVHFLDRPSRFFDPYAET